jgi:RimJ/RimL family protein N-acetyltransferase
MDSRITGWIEDKAGFSLDMFPDQGIRIEISTARSDEPKNRLLAQHIEGQEGVLITVIPRLLEPVRQSIHGLTARQLFSASGLAIIKHALPPDDTAHLDENYGLDYFLADSKIFQPVTPRHKVLELKKKDIPRGDEALRLSERRSTETGDFTWAFACYHNDPSLPAKVLPEYGPRCASVAVIFWRDDVVAGLGVATEEGLRGQGYATDVVSVATQFLLAQGAVAWYGAYADNLPSFRIPIKLGYSLVYSSFSA